MTPEQRAEYLIHLANGMRRRAAAVVMEIPFTEVESLLETEPIFTASVREAEDTATETIEEAIWQAAASGSIPAAKLWFTIKGVGRGPGKPPAPPEAPDPDTAGVLGDLE